MGRNKFKKPDRGEIKLNKKNKSLGLTIRPRRTVLDSVRNRWCSHRSLWLFSQTMRGAAPFSAARAAVNTRPGAYDREMVRHLDDYADRDTELYAAAVQLYEERLAAARQGRACL